MLPPGWDAAVGTVLPEPDVVPSAVLPGCVAELVGVVLLLPGWDAAVVGVVLLPGWLAELLSVLLPGCAADDDSEDVPGLAGRGFIIFMVSLDVRLFCLAVRICLSG